MWSEGRGVILSPSERGLWCRAPRVRLRTLLPMEPAALALLVLRRMHVHHIRHQRGRLAGLAGLLVLPLIGLHPATDRDERPLHHFLRGLLGLRSPHLHPLPQRVAGVLPLVGVPVELAWGVRDRERTRRVPVRCESEFRVLTGAALHAHAVAHCCPFRLMYRAGSMRSGTDSCRPERSVTASGGLPACLGRSAAVIGSRPAFA